MLPPMPDAPPTIQPPIETNKIASPDDREHWWVRAALAAITIGGIVAVLLMPGMVGEILTSLVDREYSRGLLHPAILATSALLFVWERYWPVGGRKISGPAHLTDIGWWFFNAAFAVSVPIVAATLMYKATDSVSAAVTEKPEPFDILGWLPWALRYVLAILLVDFVRYVIHVIRHKVPLLWRFHATHHSTEEMHQFSAYRMHPVDYTFAVAVASIPFCLFSVPVEGFVIYQVVMLALGRTHHAAVSWKWPWLNKILVSPEAHRIHHSTDEIHYDKNYGLTFSIWDRIFGTYVEPQSDDPTPVTGVPGLPSPEAKTYAEVPGVLLQQLLAPFRKFGKKE